MNRIAERLTQPALVCAVIGLDVRGQGLLRLAPSAQLFVAIHERFGLAAVDDLNARVVATEVWEP